MEGSEDSQLFCLLWCESTHLCCGDTESIHECQVWGCTMFEGVKRESHLCLAWCGWMVWCIHTRPGSSPGYPGRETAELLESGVSSKFKFSCIPAFSSHSHLAHCNWYETVWRSSFLYTEVFTAPFERANPRRTEREWPRQLLGWLFK